MTESPQKTPLEATLQRHVVLARVWLFWETYAPVFVSAALILGLFLVGTFVGLWERIGDPWRGLVLLTALAYIFRAAYRAQKRRLPTLSDAKRRVETDSQQSHRPLDVLEDSPAIGSSHWEPHQARALDQAKKLKSPKLRPTLSPKDPYYLRYALPLAVFGAMIFGSGANMDKLKSAVTPIWQHGVNPQDVTFEAWIDPPDYTGRPPIYFKGQDVPSIPEGSEFVARLKGAKTVTRPKLQTQGRTKSLRLIPLSDTSFEARSLLNSKGRAVWRIGSKTQIWDLNVVADTPPIVTITGTPEADKQDRLVLNYSFEDDYGVTALKLDMAEILDGDDAPFERSSQVSIPLAGGSLPKAEEVDAKLDLSRHPLAGKKVIARLIAIDGANHSAVSEPVWFTVPDKIFVEPLAKAIIEQRNLIQTSLETDYAPLTRGSYTAGMIYNTYEPEMRLDRAPDNVQQAALLMEAVTLEPEGFYKDPTVYLALRNIRSRLRFARDASILSPIPDELWSVALRAEFGILGSALEEMREAEQALRDGMARRAPQREIDTLFERYNNAVEAYTEELRRKALEEGNFAEQSGGGGAGGVQSTDEIEELLKAIEEANRAGDVDGARRALARLAEVLENMQIQLAQSQGEGGGEGLQGEMSEEMKENLEELADLLGEQRELQDETEEAERNQNEGDTSGQDPNQDNGDSLSPGELAERQEQLQDLLGRLGENAGALNDEGGDGEPQAGASDSETDAETGAGTQDSETGEGSGGTESAEEELGRAGDAMAGAAQALQQGDLGAAAQAQGEAIQALREAGQALAEAALGGEDGQGGETDPLGREQGDANSDNAEADIDPRDKAERSRELMEELRRRAAEQEREKQEREYLERLLKRF